MLKPINRANKSINYTLSAPCGGLNMRDSLDDMDLSDAVKMDNYIPKDTKVVLRKGYTQYAKSETSFLTLSSYKKYNKSLLLGISGGKAYNLTSKNNVKTIEGVNFTNSRCQTFQYKDRLFFMNGVDKPKVFYIDEEENEKFEDWNLSAENLLPEKIISGAVSKQFLWFVEKGSLNVWYTSEGGNIAGDLYKFDLSSVSRFGGYLVAVCCWMLDGGQGIDDLTVFLTSEGEALVYSGSNPNDVDNWSLKGSYKIAKPIGYKCTLAYQGDVVIITEDGYMPLSKVLPLNQASNSAIAFSDKIRGLVLERTSHNKNKEGWQAVIYSKGGYAIFNVPVYNNYEQHVININNGAWCRFTNIKSHCWELFEGRLYFGSDYGVYLFDDGYSDAGNHIYGEVEQAYSNLGFDGLKKIQLLNPRTKSSAQYALVIYTNMDFEDQEASYAENVGIAGVTKWNEAKWSNIKNPIGTKWQTLRGKIRSQWIANSSTGYKASIVFKTKTRGNLIEWYDTGVRYETAGGIL